MFDYFKKAKQLGSSEPQEGEANGKPKKDKVFIAILIVFGVIIIATLISGMTSLGLAAGEEAVSYGFKFGIGDGIMLGGIVIGYIVTRIRKGRK